MWKKITRGIRLRAKRLFRGSTIPVLSPVLTQYPVLIPLKEIYRRLSQMGNKYEVYRVLTEIDPELYGALNRLALMVRWSYKGVGVSIGRQLDEKERELLKIVEDFEKRWELPKLFYSIAFHLLRDGDDIYALKFQRGSGLVDMKPLPIPYVTILESEDQIGNVSAQVFERNLYVLNEFSQDKLKTWTKDEIAHFALNNQAEIVRDVHGRLTFGVWSVSPIEPLKARLQWKLAILINDILLRQKLVPREHHKLDLSAFDPALFAGETLEDRIQAAKKAALKHIDEYKTNITDPLKEVDKSYITGKDVEIQYVEPRYVSYIDPNPLIDQISRSIMAATGAPEAAVTGRGRGTYATELVVASYATLCAEAIADIIKGEMLKIIRRHVRLKYNTKFTDEDLNKIDIKIKLMLGLEKGEAARRAAILGTTGIATMEELRSEVGLLRPLTEEEKAQLASRAIGRGRQIAERTIEDILNDYLKRKEQPEPVTPESHSQRQKT